MLLLLRVVPMVISSTYLIVKVSTHGAASPAVAEHPRQVAGALREPASVRRLVELSGAYCTWHLVGVLQQVAATSVEVGRRRRVRWNQT